MAGSQGPASGWAGACAPCWREGARGAPSRVRVSVCTHVRGCSPQRKHAPSSRSPDAEGVRGRTSAGEESFIQTVEVRGRGCTQVC